MKNLIISFDLSTTCTGYAVFDVDSKRLLECGSIKPDNKTSGYPYASLQKMRSIADDIGSVIKTWEKKGKIKCLVFEEIIKGSSGIVALKVLAGLFFIVLDRLKHQYPVKTTPPSEWRKKVGIKFSDDDKAYNKAMRKAEKDTLTHKDLALRLGREMFNYYDFKLADHDVIESCLIGYSFLN